MGNFPFKKINVSHVRILRDPKDLKIGMPHCVTMKMCHNGDDLLMPDCQIWFLWNDQTKNMSDCKLFVARFQIQKKDFQKLTI